MSKPTVKVKDKQYALSQISVILKLNSCPLINLRLSEKLDGTETQISNEETFKQEFFADICSEAEGSFVWGDTLKFFLIGYNSPEARTFELVGLIVKKDLIDWFNQNNFKEKKEDYLIYQKGKGKNSWIFFNMVLEDKFKQPSQDFINKTDLLFPDNGCIWRYKESNNFHFLNRAVAFASRHLPQVQGWCGFDDSKPLRLIVFEEEKQDKTIPKLDNTWAASSYPFVPNRYSWNRWLDKSSTLTRELSIQNGQEMALIKKLTSHGLNDEDGKSYQAQKPTQLLFSLGTITIGEKNIFCHTITYEFKLPAFGEESPSVTMKIEVDYPERQIGDNEIVSLRLPGKFKEWHQKKDGETEIKIVSSDLKNWGIIDEGSQSLKSGNDAVLSTQILSRTYSNKKYSGIYIKHKKDDEMIVEIHPCSIPLVLGSVQKYRKELEEADVTLSGQKLAISVSGHHQSLEKSSAIVLDSSEIKLNHGKKIFAQAQKQVDFLSQNVEIGSSQIKIHSGKTNINSLVNISFPSPKFVTPNVSSSSGVTNNVNPPEVNDGKTGNKQLPASLIGGAESAPATSSMTPEQRVKRRKVEQLQLIDKLRDERNSFEQALKEINDSSLEKLSDPNLPEEQRKQIIEQANVFQQKLVEFDNKIKNLENNNFDNFPQITASPTEVFKEDPEDFLKNNILIASNELPDTIPGGKEHNAELINSGIKSFTLEEFKKNHYKLKIVNNDDEEYPNKIRAAYFPYKTGSPGKDLENIGHIKLDDNVDFAFTGPMNGCAMAVTSNDDGSLEAWHFQSPEDHPNALETFRKSKQLREWYNFEEYHKSDPNPGENTKVSFEANNFLYKKGNEWNILSQEVHFDINIDLGGYINHRYSEPQIRKFDNHNDAKKRFDEDLRAIKEKKLKQNGAENNSKQSNNV